MRKRALVVGLGIAGMSAASGLRRAGWAPVITERAPERRTGGYFINLTPEGMRAVDDLGLDILHTRNPERGTTWSLNRRGHRRPALGWLDLPGRPTAMVRGDVEAALWQRIRPDGGSGESGVEVRFSTAPVEIVGDGTVVEVELEDVSTGRRSRESFDLVVGADGLRSTVRSLAFGPHERFMTTWNAMICAFSLPGQAPSFGAQDSLISARSGGAVWVFGLADRAPTALLTYCAKDVGAQFTGDRTERLRDVSADMDHPAVRHVLDALPTTTDCLFDSVHQVKMDRWSTGRVLLMRRRGVVPEPVLGHGHNRRPEGRGRTRPRPRGAPRRPARRAGRVGSPPAPVHHQASAHGTAEAPVVRTDQPRPDRSSYARTASGGQRPACRHRGAAPPGRRSGSERRSTRSCVPMTSRSARRSASSVPGRAV